MANLAQTTGSARSKRSAFNSTFARHYLPEGPVAVLKCETESWRTGMGLHSLRKKVGLSQPLCRRDSLRNLWRPVNVEADYIIRVASLHSFVTGLHLLFLTTFGECLRNYINLLVAGSIPARLFTGSVAQRKSNRCFSTPLSPIFHIKTHPGECRSGLHWNSGIQNPPAAMRKVSPTLSPLSSQSNLLQTGRMPDGTTWFTIPHVVGSNPTGPTFDGTVAQPGRAE